MPHCNKQMISFFLTTKCNLNCIYCYNVEERKRMEEKTLPSNIAKAGIDHFFKENKSRHIRFYGPGEPTQEFKLMKQITDYAKAVDDKVTAEIQTNGVFNSEVREWLLNNVNIIWISFDGEPSIQNKNRPCIGGKPSSPFIEDNVRWLVSNSKNKDIMVGARVTITDANINRQKRIVDYFLSLGIKNIWNDPLFPAVDNIPVCNDPRKQDTFHFDMDAYVDNYLEAYQYAKSIGSFYGSFLICNFDGYCDKHCRACTPVPHLTPDGYVSACDLVTFGAKAHHMDCFVYGKWNEATMSFEFDEHKIAALQNRTTENMPHCRECFAKEQCGGYCLGEVMNEAGNMYGQKISACKAIKRLLRGIGKREADFQYLHP